MNIKVNVITCGACDDCKITVQDKSTYLAEDSTSTEKGEFKYSETVSVDVLQLNKISESIYLSPIFTSHTINEETTEQEEVSMYMDSDGWFSLIHIILPSVEWFNKAKEEGTVLDLYDIIYYTDGASIYKYVNRESSQVDISEVLERNTTENTTILKTTENVVSICFLQKCYVNLCNQIFDNSGFSSCWNRSKIDSDLIFKRDLVWMAINVVKYYTECNSLAEAERIIESINGCNGLCTPTNLSNNTSSCGCSK